MQHIVQKRIDGLLFALVFLLFNILEADFFSHLLLHSSKSNVPVWPFLTLSFFGGIYALLPYFVLWKPPPPPVEETQLKTWPLNFLESKVTALVSAHLNLLLQSCCM